MSARQVIAFCLDCWELHYGIPDSNGVYQRDSGLIESLGPRRARLRHTRRLSATNQGRTRVTASRTTDQ